MEVQRSRKSDAQVSKEVSKDDELPQCKIKRNYSCNHCTYFTQNPRFHLTHLRDIHGEKIVINKCNLCLYASRHYQKLVRHMKMVHGSTEGIAGQSRKRASPEKSPSNQQQKRVPTPPLPPLLYPIEVAALSGNLSNDLEVSRNSLKDIAALYFAENQIGSIMSQMEEADAVQLPPMVRKDLSISVKRKPPVSSFFDEIKKSIVHEGDINCPCGHVSKCFSETVIHRRMCNGVSDRHLDETPSLIRASGSTRCQHCRRRCKSSADLVSHLKNCLQYEIFHGRECKMSSLSGAEEPWNKADGVGSSEKDDHRFSLKFEKISGSEVEIQSVPDEEEEKCELQLPQTFKTASKEEEASISSFKKVFKCPRCSFWASTASRFHVHIVGHLNKKPFKCSLCTYRSNWRWDITKHIRLKSIRNPCHKNARVLMNDDTGRRNYTKYNRFATLMRINNEDGDRKLVKSGEMTANQVASLGYLEESRQSEDASLTECKDKLIETIWEPAEKVTEKTSPHLMRLSDDVRIDVETNGLDKRTIYKCRKCFFSHANRDAVLAHVRIHHQVLQLHKPPLTSKGDYSSFHRTAVNPASLYMNQLFAAAINLTQKQQDHKSGDRNSNRCPIRGEVTSSTGKLQQADDALKKPAASSAIQDDKLESSGKTCSAPFSGTSSGNASKSSVLMGLITSTNFGNDAPDRKNPSPFRCGHCHQVSNWKHVIQRHCRLKHSGDIRIETFDRGSGSSTPTYRPVDFCGNGQQRQSQEETMNAQQQTPSSADSSNSSMKSETVHNLQDSSVSSCNSDQDFLLKNLEISRLPNKSNSFNKQPKSSSCPYDSQDETFLLKQSQFKCTMCSYSCTKRQDLSKHLMVHESPKDMKVHETSVGPKTSDNDEATSAPAVDKGECPKEFTNAFKKQQQLQKSLSAGQEFKSPASDFSIKQETTLISHSLQPTGRYLDRLQDFKENTEFPAHKIQTNTEPKTSVPTCVKKSTNSQSVDVERSNPPKRGNSPKCSRSRIDIKNFIYCPHCPFKNECSKTLQCHIRHHFHVSNCRETHVCEHCDFSTHSKDDLNEHTRLHFDSINNKTSAAFYTSLEKLELIVADDGEMKRKDDKLTTRRIEFMNEPKVTKEEKKTVQEKIGDLRRRRCSGAAQKNEKKPTAITTTNHKTILVNPKTGQIIRRQ